MRHEFPPGELFPDDDLAPVTAESARYVYQLKRVNRVVIGLRELELSLGEKLQIACSLLGSLNEGLEETRLARAAFEAQAEQQKELVAAVKALAARMPDSEKMSWQVLNDVWEAIEGKILEGGDQLRETFEGTARESARLTLETVQRGYLGPERPVEHSSLLAWTRFYWRYSVFRVRKFAYDCLPVAIGVNAVFLALQYGKSFFH